MSRLTVLAAVFWAALVLRIAVEGSLSPDTAVSAPRIPLRELPLDVLGDEWTCADAPLPAQVVEVAGVADYVYRQLRRDGDGLTLLFYAGFVGGGASEGIHHPGRCFPVQGLELETEETLEVLLPAGLPVMRARENLWRKGSGGKAYSLASFYTNGGFCADELSLRLADRFPGVRYYASIILVGDLAGSIADTRRLYSDVLSRVVPRLVEHFPEAS
jgi:hypothetical protein